MITPADLSKLAHLTPAQRAQVIYADAQSDLSRRLWRAALGDPDSPADRGTQRLGGGRMDVESLMSLLGSQAPQAPAAGCACHCACACHQPANRQTQTGEREGERQQRRRPPAAIEAVATASADVATRVGSSAVSLGEGAAMGLKLGPNARFADAFQAAAARTGIPAPALAAIVDAEAAKGDDGSWNVHSRNPRSSAAGLGQFLSGTWQDLAQTAGTWLNGVAAERGWLDGRGRIQPAARAELLALRYDARASILSVADLAKRNLDQLEATGLRVRNDSETLAKAAYLGHHLGVGDARKFLAGGIEPGRARMLLAAQIGGSAAEARIADSGNPTHAHRQWLLGFIERRIRPEAFAS